jgi:large subunit ribosomal protein L49
MLYPSSSGLIICRTSVQIERTPSRELPVYPDAANGRTRIYTVVRKVRGNDGALAEELAKLFPEEKVTRRLGRVEVSGSHASAIKTWLAGLGF